MGFDTSGMFNAFSGTIFGLGNASIGNNMQNQQQEFMQNLSIKGQKEMAEFNYKLGKRMWNETGSEAQRKQLEKAGLNVALMYGGKGGGGQTASVNPGNVGQGTATRPDILQGLSLMANMKNAEASANLANAQAEKAKAETEKTKGVDTAKVSQEIINLKQDNVTEKGKSRLTEMEADIKEVESFITTATMQDSIDRIKNESLLAYQNLKQLEYRNQVDKETVNTNIGIIKQNYTNLLLETVQRKLTATKTEEEIKKIKQDVENSIQLVINDSRKTNIQDRQQLWQEQSIKIDEKLREAGLDQNERRLMLDTFRTLLDMSPTETTFNKK